MATAMELLNQGRTGLGLKGASNRAVQTQDKKLQSVEQKLRAIVDGAGDIERDFITKPAHQRNAYDIAFGKLNPASVAKSRQYQNLYNKKLELENEKVRLESARDIMNNVYQQQKDSINNSYDNLNKATSIGNDIALANASSAVGAAGGNAVQQASLKAQSNNLLHSQLLKNEAQRQGDLSRVSAQEAGVPLQLAQISASNSTVDAQRASIAESRARRQRRTGGKKIVLTNEKPDVESKDKAPKTESKKDEVFVYNINSLPEGWKGTYNKTTDTAELIDKNGKKHTIDKVKEKYKIDDTDKMIETLTKKK